ncbi:hypothetical protein ACPXCP_39060 [Streptomyces sp. DT20]|uniref:hypothetical protein n=1 Tax=Streptomyces sp. DT20 TaxID=3416519 RepID=UPI003CE75B7C
MASSWPTTQVLELDAFRAMVSNQAGDQVGVVFMRVLLACEVWGRAAAGRQSWRCPGQTMARYSAVMSASSRSRPAARATNTCCSSCVPPSSSTSSAWSSSPAAVPRSSAPEMPTWSRRSSAARSWSMRSAPVVA